MKQTNVKNRYADLTSFLGEVVGSDLKVAILVAYFLKGHGVARVVSTQAKELVSNDYDVTIFTLESDMSPPENVCLVKIGAPKNIYLKAFNQVFSLFNIRNYMLIRKLSKYDVIITHQHTLAPLAFLARKKFSIPFIYYNHPVVSDKELFHNIFYWLFMRFNESSFNFFAKKADYVISISEYARKLLYEKTKIESVVIYNSVDADIYRDVDGKRVREKYNLGDHPLLLFVGRIIPLKGVHLLIKSFGIVKEKLPESKLVIVGTHKFKDYSSNLIKLSEQFKNDIIFTGYIPDEELPHFYAACDVYVTASLHEGFNLPALEAQAFGKPVVAFDIGPHKELIKNGFLVEKGNVRVFADKIVEILENRTKLQTKVGKRYEKKEYCVGNLG